MKEIRYIPVSEIMDPKIHKIDGLDSVSEVIKSMKDAKCSALIVDKRDDNDEYGLISIGDLAVNVVIPDASTDRMSAYQIMTKPVLSVESDMNIRYAIRLLTRFKVSRALVLQDGRAVGIVELRDMVLNWY